MQNAISGAMLLLKLASLYFLVVALFALKKPKPIPRANPNMRFACVIAARNEERVIGGLIESLLRQTYPKALFDIYVMPNNCTDHTALAAIHAGAQVLRPEGEIRCKGDALHEVFETLLKKDYDAFCVFDADNFVDPAFLSRMNDAFCAGAKAAKGAMRVKNPEDSPLCACYGLYFTCFDFFFSRARMNCGLSSKLVGTGFAVHRSVLEASGGWNSVKLYFMLGLPTETDEDVAAIAELVNKIVYCWRQSATNKKRRLSINLATAFFVPKPFTPFQWEKQTSPEEYLRRVHLLQNCLTARGVDYRYHESDLSRLEAVLARGDRRLSKVLLRAHELGCKLDGWDEYFRYDLWMQAFSDCGVDPEFYTTRGFAEDEILPWQTIDIGVSWDFFLRERALAYESVTTPDCRTKCAGCGARSLSERGVCDE